MYSSEENRGTAGGAVPQLIRKTTDYLMLYFYYILSTLWNWAGTPRPSPLIFLSLLFHERPSLSFTRAGVFSTLLFSAAPLLFHFFFLSAFRPTDRLIGEEQEGLYL